MEEISLNEFLRNWKRQEGLQGVVEVVEKRDWNEKKEGEEEDGEERQGFGSKEHQSAI